jgi:hypothetical protein
VLYSLSLLAGSNRTIAGTLTPTLTITLTLTLDETLILTLTLDETLTLTLKPCPGERSRYYTVLYSLYLVSGSMGPLLGIALFKFWGDHWAPSQLCKVMVVGTSGNMKGT